jgi:DNA polymerase
MSAPDAPLNPLAALHVFKAHLEARARAGETKIWMSDEARAMLKEICRMKPGRMTFTAPKPEVTPAPPVKQEAPPAAATFSAPEAVVSSADREPAAAQVEAPAPVAPQSKAERLAAVQRRAEDAPKARALGTLRDTMVFATGNPDAQIMFVGEAPGADEEKQREPFVGVAGQLLTRVIKAMGLERSDVYITNICKFRPIVEDDRPQGTRNHQPTGTEMAACMEYVLEEIAIVQPRVIVALGKTAAEGLLQRDVAVTRLRGQWLEFKGTPLTVTFHPSYLKRKEDEGEAIANAEKRKHWEDMLMVMERLDMNITDKQRRYFLPKS